MPEIGLPSAEHQTPSCGACHSETEHTGYDFACYECGLCFDYDNLAASFIDEDAKVCGAPCDNTWHADNAIRDGQGYDCHTCQLPADHPSFLHWTGCTPKALTP